LLLLAPTCNPELCFVPHVASLLLK
jgi:hypothetical protein